MKEMCDIGKKSSDIEEKVKKFREDSDALPEQDEREERDIDTDVMKDIEEEKLRDVGKKSRDIEEEEKSIPVNVDSDGEEKKSGDIEEEKPLVKKNATKEKVCETADCKNPVKEPMGCAECKTLGIQGRFFCSQACFNSVWTLHKQVHKKARKERDELI